MATEAELKTVVDYLEKGKKRVKAYDAFVIEAMKEKYVKVQLIDDGSDHVFLLTWDSFMYSGEFFGNKLTCQYDVKRDFVAEKTVTSAASGPVTIAKRRRSGRPNR
tara:strand:+ start:772 stop:1089 length:318 start_codon:yes stop_codon:yes gene_type:complete